MVRNMILKDRGQDESVSPLWIFFLFPQRRDAIAAMQLRPVAATSYQALCP